MSQSGECYCGNEVRTAKYTSGCDITCPGRGTEKCGGLFRVSVYNVEGKSEFAFTLIMNDSFPFSR
jgi:hypothetical protein